MFDVSEIWCITVDQVLRLIPDATALIDKLTVQAEKVNNIGQQLTFDITELREKIALSREEASRVSSQEKRLGGVQSSADGALCQLRAWFGVVQDKRAVVWAARS